MTFDVEVVLKGRDFAVTEAVTIPQADPEHWTDSTVRAVLIEVLRAVDHVQNPGGEGRLIALRGFSWIVDGPDGAVVIAIEIPTGAAVAGPFKITQKLLDEMITRVLQQDRQQVAPQTIH